MHPHSRYNDSEDEQQFSRNDKWKADRLDGLIISSLRLRSVCSTIRGGDVCALK